MTAGLADVWAALAVTITMAKSARTSGAIENRVLGFPVEPNIRACDAITAVDRVVGVLEAVAGVT